MAETEIVTLLIEPEATERVPLTLTARGIVLVEGTRVPLDTVVDAFNAGMSAEEIALNYPTLGLADLYAILAYYLHHRADVDAYVAEQRQEATSLRARVEAGFGRKGIRERLLARQSAQQA